MPGAAGRRGQRRGAGTRFTRGLRLPALLLAAGIGAAAPAAGVAAGVGAASRPPSKLTVFSSPTRQIFLNNDDDRERGDVNNPFGTHGRSSADPNENKNGPFAGDEAVYTFTMYGAADLGTKVGSATYTCEYYLERNAFCDASFELKGGTLIAAGILNFDDQRFTLAVTGGYGKYGHLRGDVQVTPSGKHAQRLAFVLG